MLSRTPLRSVSGAFIRSPSGCLLLPGDNCTYSIIVGIVPVWGFGTIAGLPDPANAIQFNITWPNVWQTMTETWTNHAGGVDLATVTKWSQNTDVVITVETSGEGNDVSNSDLTGFSVSDDGLSATGTYTDTSDLPGTYTVVLSDPFSPTGGTDNWATRTAQAAGLCGNVATALAFGGNPDVVNNTTIVAQVSTSPGWGTLIQPDTIPTDYTGQYAGEDFICAAANGLGVFASLAVFTSPGHQAYSKGAPIIFTGTPGIVSQNILPSSLVSPSILDNIGYSSTALANCQNAGAIVCVRSAWMLSGGGLGSSDLYGLAGTDYNHVAFYGQQLTFPSGAPTLGSVIVPASFTTANIISAAGVSSPNPLTTWPKQYVFNPGDILANLWASGSNAPYGLIGFRSATI